MTIKLFTGLDGTGKTLAMVDMACTLKEKAEEAKKSGKEHRERKLYYWGIDGLKDGIAEPIEHPSKWVDLPPGSILMIDECSKVFGNDELGRKLPDWVKELREHRHHAVDIVMSCQDPTQLHLYVRKLIKWHVHHVRKFGSRNIQRFEWSSCVNTPTATASIKRGRQSVWRLPKHRYAMYESAKEHHEKLRLPLRLAVFPLGLVALVVLGIYAWGFIGSLVNKHGASVGAAAAQAAASDVLPAAASIGGQAKPVTAEEWVAARTPRVPGIPWSAPMWDGLTAEGVPDLYCVQAEQEDGSKRCSCYTEQVTKVEGIPTAVCSRIASEGIYNPYRRSGEGSRSRRGGDDRAEASSGAVASSRGEVPASRWRATIPQGYTPPELTQVSAIGAD